MTYQTVAHVLHNYGGWIILTVFWHGLLAGRSK